MKFIVSKRKMNEFKEDWETEELKCARNKLMNYPVEFGRVSSRGLFGIWMFKPDLTGANAKMIYRKKGFIIVDHELPVELTTNIGDLEIQFTDDYDKLFRDENCTFNNLLMDKVHFDGDSFTFDWEFGDYHESMFEVISPGECASLSVFKILIDMMIKNEIEHNKEITIYIP